MIFLVAEIQLEAGNAQTTTLQAWINTHSQANAHMLVWEQLEREGWQLVEVVECTATTQDDYFPPCTSLDAFREAEQRGLALRLT